MNTTNTPSQLLHAAGAPVGSHGVVQRVNSYQVDLHDPLWFLKRDKIKTRDNWTCQRCGCFHLAMHVHHTVYFPNRKPWQYPDEVLVTLCCECHPTIHGFDLLSCDEAWFWNPDPLALACAKCANPLKVSEVAGRMGKREPLCEPCVLSLEREYFAEESRS